MRVRNYPSEGILIARKVFRARDHEQLLDDIQDLFARQLNFLPKYAGNLIFQGRDALHANIRELLLEDAQRYISTCRATQEIPNVMRALLAVEFIARDLGIVQPLMSTKPSVHIMADDLAVPGGYHRSPAHQDWRSIQGSLDNIVLWIPLTPVRGNGLEVIRGSHTYGLLPTKEHIMTPEVIDPEKLGPWEAIDCEPGDVVAFSSFLVHRTAAGPGLRIAISTRFNNAEEPTFIERGYPTSYSYSYRRDVPWEPPHDKTV